MKKLILICSFMLLALQGCSILPLRSFIFIDINKNYYPNNSVVFKSIPHTWECDGSKEAYSHNEVAQYPRKYVFISDCHMEPNDYIPETITVEYAPWLTDEEQEAKGIVYPENKLGADLDPVYVAQKKEAIRLEQLDISKIPASQWHKIVLHPQELVKKYKGVTPDGEGVRSAGKEISYSITLNKDGTYKVEDSVSWRTPISHNWAN